jgi:hypothetical protein
MYTETPGISVESLSLSLSVSLCVCLSLSVKKQKKRKEFFFLPKEVVKNLFLRLKFLKSTFGLVENFHSGN